MVESSMNLYLSQHRVGVIYIQMKYWNHKGRQSSVTVRARKEAFLFDFSTERHR
jgi:hypothetical protein